MTSPTHNRSKNEGPFTVHPAQRGVPSADGPHLIPKETDG